MVETDGVNDRRLGARAPNVALSRVAPSGDRGSDGGSGRIGAARLIALCFAAIWFVTGAGHASAQSPPGSCSYHGWSNTWTNVHNKGAAGNPGRYEFNPHGPAACGTKTALPNDNRDFQSTAANEADILPTNDYAIAVSRFRVGTNDISDRAVLMFHKDYWEFTGGQGAAGCSSRYQGVSKGGNHRWADSFNCSDTNGTRAFKFDIRQKSHPSNTGTVEWTYNASERITSIKFNARLNAQIALAATASPDPAPVFQTVTLNANATLGGPGLPGTTFRWKQVADDTGDENVVIPADRRVGTITNSNGPIATFTAPPGRATDVTVYFKITVSAMSGTPLANTKTEIISMTLLGDPAYIPDLFSMSPVYGPTGTVTKVTLTGQDFVSGKTTVNFGDVSIVPTSVTSSEIEFDAPASSVAKTVPVSVSLDGIESVNKLDFTYIDGAPTARRMTPGRGSISDGDIEVTITGKRLLDSPGTKIHINHRTPNAVEIPRSDITFHSLQSITFTMPARTVPGADRVKVETALGESNVQRFGRSDSPAIFTVTPATGDVAGGDVVTITGDRFVNGGHQEHEVHFGRGNPAKILSVSDTQIIVETPPGTKGPVDIFVRNHREWHGSDAEGFELNGFTYAENMVIEKIEPRELPSGWTGPVTITGRHFNSNDIRVLWGTVRYMPSVVTVVSPTEITINFRAQSDGAKRVMLTLPDHPSSNDYTVVHGSAAPAIYEMSQTRGSVAGGYRVTLKGVNFGPTMNLMVGSTQLLPSDITLVGPEDPTLGYKEASFEMPGVASSQTVNIIPYKAQSGNPRYRAGDRTLTAGRPFPFTYIVDARDNLELRPALGDYRGGERVTIRALSGQSFVANDIAGTTVLFGDRVATVNDVRGATITVTTPANKANRMDVTLTHDGRTMTVNKGFRYMGKPRVRWTDPPNGSMLGGEKIHVDGFDFLEGGTEVYFGGVKIPDDDVTWVNRRKLYVITPAQASAGPVDLMVKTLGPVVTYSSDPISFTFVNRPRTMAAAVEKAVTGPTVEIIAPDKADRLEPFRVIARFSEAACDRDGSILKLSNATVASRPDSCSDLGNASQYAAEHVFSIKPTGTGDVTITVPEGVAQNFGGELNHASETATVGVVDVVALTQKFIQDNMLARARRIVGEEDPDMLKRRLVESNSGGPIQLSMDNAPGKLSVKFQGGLKSVDRKLKVLAADTARVSNSGRAGPHDFWIKGSYVQEDTGDSTLDAWLFYVGADYRLSENTIVGLLGQIDSTRNNDTTAGTSFSGLGWMIGPYFAMRVHDKLIIDGRMAFGMSTNDINPIGYYLDEFETMRWLIRFQATGEFGLGHARLNPFVQLVYFHETQQEYMDTPGNEIPEQSITLGQLRFGPELRFHFETQGGTKLSPYGSVSGVWEFDEVDQIVGVETVSGDGDVRPRIDFGFDLSGSPGFTIGIAGFYDGFGSDDVEAWGGSLRVVIPLGGRVASARPETRAEAPRAAYIPDTTGDNAAGIDPPADRGVPSGFASDG